MKSVSIGVPGKWVLAGEHSVLRGGSALVLPRNDIGLSLRYFPGDKPLRIDPAEYENTIRTLIEKVEEEEGRVFSLSGDLFLKSTIPIGAGLGSSAALCVAMVQFLLEKETLSDRERELARLLENQFHGKSSGMDVTVISKGMPLLFSMEGFQSLELKKLPRFQFLDTGLRATTRDCVEQVHNLDASPLARIDREMRDAVQAGLEGLQFYSQGDQGEGLRLLVESMDLSWRCYEQWDLIPDSIRLQREDLLKSGALAVRLTGAGKGGFLVALLRDA